MSGTAGHPLLRSRIADRLATLAQDGQRALARKLGVSSSTANRWADGDPYSFGFHAVDLAISDDELWEAIVAYRHGDQRVSGEAVRVTGDLFAVMTSCTELMAEVVNDLRDGRITPAESKRLLKLLRRIVAMIDERVIPDLEALHG